MGEWSDLVRLKQFKKVFRTNWSRKVTISTFKGDKNDLYQGEINARISVNDMSGDPKSDSFSETLAKFLSSDFSKFIASDRVRDYAPSKYPKVGCGWETYVDNPALDGRDSTRDKMTDVYTKWLTKTELIEINLILKSQKMRPLQDLKAIMETRNQTLYGFEFGRVPS